MKKGADNVLARQSHIFRDNERPRPENRNYTRDEIFLRAKDDVTDLWAYYTYRDLRTSLDGKDTGHRSPGQKPYEAGIPYGPEDGHAITTCEYYKTTFIPAVRTLLYR